MRLSREAHCEDQGTLPKRTTGNGPNMLERQDEFAVLHSRSDFGQTTILCQNQDIVIAFSAYSPFDPRYTRRLAVCQAFGSRLTFCL